MTELTLENRQEHWRRTRNLTIVHLVVWFFFAYLIHWFASDLHGISFFGWPLNYYMAAQGSLAAFVIQLFLFNRQQHKIDVEFGVDEEVE
jgi:putative solute:sodium symporter small subunit